MSYTDLIRQEGEYTYSANIQFDIANDRKLIRFIPNETTVDMLREYFIDITRSTPTHHARILYGSYGTGKSHYLTVLSLLLSKTYTDGVAYSSFLEKIQQYDINLAVDIDKYVKDNSTKPFLIVPIVFDFEDFDRCIYFSLNKKLESVGKHVRFKTFYDQALLLLEQWEENEESNTRLIDTCKKANISLPNLEKKLRSFDKKAESAFQKVFSEMTFGVKYIYEVSNLADTLSQVYQAISDEYSGIIFIFDEFGRYMEDNIKKIKVKSVQDLAEYCDHSEGNHHIILVSHKEISQYTQRINKNIATEWKKVEGRYKATPINDKQDQCLSLIRNILVKQSDVWDAFCERFASNLNNMYSEAMDFRGFLIDVARGENPFEGGYPLHPISLYALDKLSKRVAQNERTFFTYLASQEDNSLYHFLSRYELDEFHFVGIDEIYNYFEPSIKSVQSDSSYEWYKNLQSALSKNHSSTNDDTPEVKILKVIAIIGIINDASTLRANKSTLLSVIDCPKEIVSNALEGLCERRIVKYSGSYDRYDFFEASIFDVERMIQEETKFSNDDAVIKVLNEEFVDFVLYPNQYNRNYKISRVFTPIFSLPGDLNKRNTFNRFGRYYDGVLVMLLLDPSDDLEDIIKTSTMLPKAIIFTNADVQELKYTVKQYISVKYFESKKAEYASKDPSFEKELQYYKDELKARIFAFIVQWKNNFSDENTIICSGRVCPEVSSFSDLSTLASRVCLEVYPDTLIVNNELINKNTISGSITLAKKHVISGILEGKTHQDYYGVDYLSPDYIAVRSVLVKNGFIIMDSGEIEQNRLADGRQPQEALHGVLNTFIERAKNENINFEEIYTLLKESPFGLKNGYLSMLFAHILAPYKKSLIISSHNVEQELTVDLFEEIIRRPNDFSFMIASWTSAQMDYLDALEHVYEDYINKTTLSKNRLKAIYEAMLSHYTNVPKFARTTKNNISPEAKAYRKVLEKTHTNYSTFLFNDLHKLGGSYIGTVETIKKIKVELESCLTDLSNELSISICNLFNVPPTTSLDELFRNGYTTNWAHKRQKSFDYYTNAFLEFTSRVQVGESDYDLILRLSKALTGFELIYWNDSHKNEFIGHLKEVKAKLDAYRGSDKLTEHETKMTLVTSSGQEKSVVFDRTELSTLSQTVKNKIDATFGNYGLAISYDEKVQILLSLLEDMMEGK